MVYRITTEAGEKQLASLALEIAHFVSQEDTRRQRELSPSLSLMDKQALLIVEHFMQV